MAGLLTLKEIGKVGNKALVRAAGLVESIKRKVITEVIDYNKCPAKCNVSKLLEGDEKRKRAYCLQFCPFNQVTQEEKTVYEYEHHKYKIRLEERCETERLSRSQLLLYITYHLMPITVDGIIKHADVAELAKKMGVNARTIRRANEKLKELDIIDIIGSQKSVYSVLLPDYKGYHLTRKEGGTGYVQMTKEFLESLYKMAKVNSIRLALRLLLLFEKEVVVGNEPSCVVTYAEMKRFLPKNMNHKKIIDECLQAIENLFTLEKHDKYVVVELKDAYNGKVQKEVKERQFSEEIQHFVNEHNLYLPVEKEEEVKEEGEVVERYSPTGERYLSLQEVMSLYRETAKENAQTVQLEPFVKEEEVRAMSATLAMEYGVEQVKKELKRAFDLVKSQKPNTPDEIFNIGGFIRVGIQNDRNKQYLAKTTY